MSGASPRVTTFAAMQQEWFSPDDRKHRQNTVESYEWAIGYHEEKERTTAAGREWTGAYDDIEIEPTDTAYGAGYLGLSGSYLCLERVEIEVRLIQCGRAMGWAPEEKEKNRQAD